MAIALTAAGVLGMLFYVVELDTSISYTVEPNNNVRNL
jgi:hypothetical protein